MGLTTRKEEQLRKMPIIESKVGKSKDGKYLIHRTVITTVRPVKYYQAILDNQEQVEIEDLDFAKIEA
jgi:hypothetical protein